MQSCLCRMEIKKQRSVCGRWLVCAPKQRPSSSNTLATNTGDSCHERDEENARFTLELMEYWKSLQDVSLHPGFG